MKELNKENKIEEIDAKTMYRMIQELLRRDMYYEAKCLVNLFIEKRNSQKELTILKEIKILLLEYKVDEVNQIVNNVIKSQKKFPENLVYFRTIY